MTAFHSSMPTVFLGHPSFALVIQDHIPRVYNEVFYSMSRADCGGHTLNNLEKLIFLFLFCLTVRSMVVMPLACGTAAACPASHAPTSHALPCFIKSSLSLLAVQP